MCPISAGPVLLCRRLPLDGQHRPQGAAGAHRERPLGRPTDHNTFNDPERVGVAPLPGIALRDGAAEVILPSCAIASVEIKLEQSV